MPETILSDAPTGHPPWDEHTNHDEWWGWTVDYNDGTEPFVVWVRNVRFVPDDERIGYDFAYDDVLFGDGRSVWEEDPSDPEGERHPDHWFDLVQASAWEMWCNSEHPYP